MKLYAAELLKLNGKPYANRRYHSHVVGWQRRPIPLIFTNPEAAAAFAKKLGKKKTGNPKAKASIFSD